MHSFVVKIVLTIALGGCVTPPGSAEVAPPARDPSITPLGWDAWDTFDRLGAVGLSVAMLGRPRELPVPASLRGRLIGGRRFIEAVAEARGLKVTWVREESWAVLYEPPVDAVVEAVKRDLGAADAAVRCEAAWRCGWLCDPALVALLVRTAKGGDRDLSRQVAASLRRLGWESAWALDAGAAPLLPLDLASVDPLGRRQTVDALDLLVRDVPPQDLLKVLDDADAKVRISVAAALRGVGGERAQRILREAAGDAHSDTAVRVALALISWNFDPELTNRAFGNLLKADRRSAVKALCRMGKEQAARLIQTRMANAGPAERNSAAVLLACVAGEEALPVLTRLLGERDAGAVECAATGLGFVGGPRALVLLQGAMSTARLQTNSSALKALGRMGDERVLPVLTNALANVDVGVRCSALEALAELGGQKAEALIVKALSDPEGCVRAAAVTALSRVDSARAPALVAPLLNDADRSVRFASARALARIGSEQTLEHLLKALDSPQADVRDSVGAAVRDAKSEVALALLEKMSGGPDGKPQEGLRQYLFLLEREGERGVAILEKHARDPVMRSTALMTAGRVGGARTVSMLERELAAPQPSTGQVERALGFAGGAKARELLLQRLKTTKDGMSRQAAWRALKDAFPDDPAVQKALQDFQSSRGQ